MRHLKSFCVLATALLMSTAPALAGPVTLKANPVDDDGRVTMGDIFDGAGVASEVFVAQRGGPTVVMEAGQLQMAARRVGLAWSNPDGLRRVVVRQGFVDAVPAEAAASPAAASVARRPAGDMATVEVLTYARSLAAGDIVQPEDVVWTTVQAHQAQGGAPQDADLVIGLSARRALRAGSMVASRDLASPEVIARNDMVQVAYEVGGVRLTVTGKATQNAALGEAVTIENVQSGRAIDAVAVGPGRAVAGPAAQSARGASAAQFAAR